MRSSSTIRFQHSHPHYESMTNQEDLEKRRFWFESWRVIIPNQESVCPDLLSLERTFLAWYRGALLLAFVAVGVLINTSLVRRPRATAIIVTCIAFVLLILGTHRYFWTQYLWTRRLINTHNLWHVLGLYLCVFLAAATLISVNSPR